MNTSPSIPSSPALSVNTKREVLNRVVCSLQKRFYKPELLTEEWLQSVESHRPGIEAAATPDDFEQSMMKLLHTLNTSHLGFFHETGRLASSRAALSATYLAEETEEGRRWIFQDVHKGGAAAKARIQPGDILLRVNDREIVPPEHPTFPFGKMSAVEVIPETAENAPLISMWPLPRGRSCNSFSRSWWNTSYIRTTSDISKLRCFPGWWVSTLQPKSPAQSKSSGT